VQLEFGSIRALATGFRLETRRARAYPTNPDGDIGKGSVNRGILVRCVMFFVFEWLCGTVKIDGGEDSGDTRMYCIARMLGTVKGSIQNHLHLVR